MTWGEFSISLKDKDGKWQCLAGKIRRGKSIDRASQEAGIPLQEALAYLEENRISTQFDDDTLRIAAAEALHYGLKTLIKISKEERRVKIEAQHMGGSMTWEDTDLDAAKALLTFGLNARKMLGAQKGVGKEEPKDLFDTYSEKGPWALKDT